MAGSTALITILLYIYINYIYIPCYCFLYALLPLLVSEPSSSSSSSTPEIKFGCTDNCCADKRINVITKQEEQEELLLEAISKINDSEIKASMLHKLRKMLNKKDSSIHVLKVLN